MLYCSSLPLISAHVFCACRVCVKCAQTQISGLKNFIFQSSYPFSKLFCYRVTVGGCPLQSDTNRIQKHTASVNWKACACVLPASRQSACRVRVTCQSSERVPRRPAALKQCSVTCPCCLASQSERALRLRSAACQGTPSMLCRASRPRPHGTKCCFVGKYATKTGIWAMKRIKSRRKMGTNEREINLGRVRKESERHG